MFETPALDIQELRSVLTDAGHTVVGLATMAAKKANDVRLDVSDRYEEQTADFRSNLLTVVEKLADVRTKVEARVEPIVESLTDRLPAPARKVVETMTESVKDAQSKAHRMVVDALTVDAPKATAPAATKPAVRKPAAKKVAVKKPVAKATKATKATKIVAAKATKATKTAAKKTVAKKAVRKAA